MSAERPIEIFARIWLEHRVASYMSAKMLAFVKRSLAEAAFHISRKESVDRSYRTLL